MNVSLTPELERLVAERVASGRYTSASEVVREGLRLLEEQDQLRDVRLKYLRQAIAEGLESGPAQPMDIEQIKAEARRRSRSSKD